MSGQGLPEQQITGSDRIAEIGKAVWNALQERSIAPTPRNFELLYTHFSGLNRDLSKRLSPYLDQGHTLPAEEADALYDECLASDANTDAVAAGAEDIAEAAQGLVEQVSNNQEALTGYGDVLARSAERMAAPTTVEDLLKIVATLRAETGQAVQRNRALERQLAASTSRITKLRQNLVDVRRKSTTDALTGISNRKSFDTKLRRLLTQARTDASVPFSLVLLDVDHFKNFNDRHGHRTGDQVLRLVGRLLSDNVKGRDTAARYGGEEFAILLAGADIHAGLTISEQIRQRLSSQSLVKRGTGEAIGQITISAGVAQHRPGESGAALVERADRALYEAKRTGRNRVCLAQDVDEAAA